VSDKQEKDKVVVSKEQVKDVAKQAAESNAILGYWIYWDCSMVRINRTDFLNLLRACDLSDEHAYRESLLDIPWRFWNVRDCRTIKDLFESKRGGLNDNFTGVAHNALDDAIHQAKWVTLMWSKLRLGK